MQITVIIPVHNQSFPLAMTLDAFSRQTMSLQDVSIIVVDDASTQPIEPVIEAYKDLLPVSCIRIPKSGRAAARNKGAVAAKDGLIIFCDADRMPMPKYLQEYAEAAQAYRDTMLVGHVSEIYVPNMEQNRSKVLEYFHNPNKHRTPQYCRLVYNLYSDSGENESEIPWVSTFSGNMALPASVFHRLGGFDENFKEWGFEHFEFGYRAFLDGVPFRYLSQAGNVHLAHPRESRSYKDYIKNSHSYFYSKHPHPVIEAFRDFMLGTVSLWQLDQCVRVGNTRHRERWNSSDYVRITNF